MIPIDASPLSSLIDFSAVFAFGIDRSALAELKSAHAITDKSTTTY